MLKKNTRRNENREKETLRGCRFNKRGSYIVEASVILPAFIITVFLLISIIIAIRTYENINYGCAEELRLEMAKNAIRKNMPALPVSVYTRVRRENRNLSNFKITEYKYLYKENGLKDLIKISFKSTIDKKNPLGEISTLKYSGTMVGRAFSGTYYDGKDGGGKIVYVFPDEGKKYHNKSCRYLSAYCHQVFLNDEIKRKYHSCPNCKSHTAAMGNPVFCFERAGEAYHLSRCKSVKKYYIGISKDAALEKNYRPCSKCGG
ncbi:MAG: hypothetical protein SOR72_02450 [Hornefia sp.]|nr:hypothetical protein [Hornefia sp.]